MSQSNPNPEERSRIVQDAIKTFSGNDPQATFEFNTTEKVKEISRQVSETFKGQHLIAGGFMDKRDAGEIILKLYREKFESLTREEMIWIMTLIHTETALSRMK